MSNELQIAFNEISQMRALPTDIVLDALQSALVSAYRRDTGASAAQAIEAEIDLLTKEPKVFVEKEVVDEVIFDATEVGLENARSFNPEAELGDLVMIQVEHRTRNFGRIAAQTAKQVILQKIREAERSALYDEFITREGDLITGTVQSVNSRKVTLSMGRAEADLPRSQQIPGERYRTHEKIRVYVVEVSKSNRGPQIIVSRAHRSMLRRLLEYEVPEVYNGQVEIRAIAREAGHRSKVAVVALQDGIDPVGACVGMRGIRIQNIVRELHNEKIDVIEWNDDAVAFITKALSPARVTGVYLDDDPYAGKTAVVLVPDDQLSLAIGREGQNARLAAKLTGWRIDIKSVAETVEEALEQLDTEPLASLSERYSDSIAEAMRIMEKRRQELAIMPEEFRTLARLADVVEQVWRDERNAKRAVYMQQREAVRETLPPKLFSLPLDVLAVSQEILDILEPFENVGEVMLTTLVGESQVEKRLDALVPKVEAAEKTAAAPESVQAETGEGEPQAEPAALADTAAPKPMQELRAALDMVMAADIDQLLEEAISIEDSPEEEEALPEAELEAAPAASDTDSEPQPAESSADVAEDEVLVDAWGQPIVEAEPEPAVELAAAAAIVPDSEQRSRDIEREVDLAKEEASEREFELEMRKSKKQRRQDRQKRRQLVLDEQSGEVIAKRRRKGARDNWFDEAWDEYEF